MNIHVFSYQYLYNLLSRTLERTGLNSSAMIANPNYSLYCKFLIFCYEWWFQIAINLNRRFWWFFLSLVSA